MIKIGQVQALLAGKGYSVAESGGNTLRITDVESGLALQAALESDILFFSLACATVAKAKISPKVMELMLSSDNGIATSYFQLHEGEAGTTVTLNNFCKLQDMGAEDEDDVLSCVNFLLADVLQARHLIGDQLS